MTRAHGMDAYLAIVSTRAVRKYTDQPIPDEVLQRMLQAGRATGSASNRQPWRFYVIRNREALNQVAETFYEPSNITGCQVAIALVMTRRRSFDAGRVAQNIALAAWADGIGTCPNGVNESDQLGQILDLEEGHEVATILSAGYPDEPLRPKSSDPADVLARIDRKPLEELTHWID